MRIFHPATVRTATWISEMFFDLLDVALVYQRADLRAIRQTIANL